MAKFTIIAIFDNKVGGYEQPRFARSRGDALRMWETAANDENTPFCLHPNDFALMELAEYDDQTGVFTNHPSPVNLGLAVQFKKQPVSTMPLFEKKTGTNS